MGDQMIINVSRDLGWRRRLGSSAFTFALWFGFALLWLPVYRKLLEVIHLRRSFEPAALEVLEVVDPLSPWHSMLVLVGTCTLLLLWSLLPSRSASTIVAVESPENLAAGFGFSPEAIASAQASRLCVVHHDEHGQIMGLEPRALPANRP